MRDTSKVLAVGIATPVFTKTQIQVYSPAGESILICSVDLCLYSEFEPYKPTSCHGSGTRAR